MGSKHFSKLLFYYSKLHKISRKDCSFKMDIQVDEQKNISNVKYKIKELETAIIEI